MPKLSILTKTEQKKFDASPLLTNHQKQKFFAVNEILEDHLDALIFI